MEKIIPTHRKYKKDPLSEEQITKRRNSLIKSTGKSYPFLFGKHKSIDPINLKGNIENYIGMTQLPTGIMGPLLVKGEFAQGVFNVPLATSEGTLLASYSRGAKASLESGGITTKILEEGVQRSPVFLFSELKEALQFLDFIESEKKHFQDLISRYSRFAKIKDVKYQVNGKQLICTLEYDTGDAAGQNMVTICSQVICQYLVQKSPVKLQTWYLEGNYSGDKKANANAFIRHRGKKVTAEVIIPENIVQSILKCSSKKIAHYWKIAAIGNVQSAGIGLQGHIANGLTALFLACGQDVACVSEASVGITILDAVSEGLYASLTLPNLIVGTVGGGTHLSTQKECLEMIECLGPGKSRKFAEITAAVVLAGEISIGAALSAGHFADAHLSLGRK